MNFLRFLNNERYFVQLRMHQTYLLMSINIFNQRYCVIHERIYHHCMYLVIINFLKYMTELQQTLIAIVNEVPEWYVVSFGVVAKELMKRSHRTITAQLVGRQLSWLPESERYRLPWRRVINKEWYVSALKLWTKGTHQIKLLQNEWNEVINGFVQDPERREF